MCVKRAYQSQSADDDESFRLALVEDLSAGIRRLRVRIRGRIRRGERREGSCDGVIFDVRARHERVDLKRLLTACGSTMPVIMVARRPEQGLHSLLAWAKAARSVFVRKFFLTSMP